VGEIFSTRLGWKNRRSSFGYLSQLEQHTRNNTLVQTQQTTFQAKLFLSSLVAKKGLRIMSSRFFSQRFQGLKGLECVVERKNRQLLALLLEIFSH
jgi:hypothetical protein